MNYSKINITDDSGRSVIRIKMSIGIARLKGVKKRQEEGEC